MTGQIVRPDLSAAGATVPEQLDDRVQLGVFDQGMPFQGQGLQRNQAQGKPVQAVHIGGVDMRADGTGCGGVDL